MPLLDVIVIWALLNREWCFRVLTPALIQWVQQMRSAPNRRNTRGNQRVVDEGRCSDSTLNVLQLWRRPSISQLLAPNKRSVTVCDRYEKWKREWIVDDCCPHPAGEPADSWADLGEGALSGGPRHLAWRQEDSAAGRGTHTQTHTKLRHRVTPRHI